MSCVKCDRLVVNPGELHSTHKKLEAYEKKEERTDKVRLQFTKQQEHAGFNSKEVGTFLETKLEEYWHSKFPFDVIQRLDLGTKITGKRADHLVTVVDNGDELGKILIEYKDTMTYSTAWEDKLKDELVQYKASIALLVSTALPYRNKISTRIGQSPVFFIEESRFEVLSIIYREFVKEMHFNQGLSSIEPSYFNSDEFKNGIRRLAEIYSVQFEYFDKARDFINKQEMDFLKRKNEMSKIVNQILINVEQKKLEGPI